MQDEGTFPFTAADSRRVIDHPDTPCAYIEWREVLPLVSDNYRTFLGNLLGWSFVNAGKTLGGSRQVFNSVFPDATEDTIDALMSSLADVAAREFLDHIIPFLYNTQQFSGVYPSDSLIDTFLGLRASQGASLFPEHLIIEITRSCNFSCTMCSSRTRGYKRENTMALEDFGEVVRVLGTKATSIRLNGYGESTIVPGFMRYVDCLDEFDFKGLKEIVTNLSAPSEIYEELANRGFVQLISWDATGKALFESIRRGARYEKLLSTLKALGRLTNGEPERLVMLSTVQESNVGEIDKLVQLAADVGVGVVIFNMVKEQGGSPWMSSKFGEIMAQFERAKNIADGKGILVKIPDHLGSRNTGLEYSTSTSMTRCNMPYEEALVHWDLEMTVCNMFNPYSFGQLFLKNLPTSQQDMKQRATQLFNGPNAQLFRSLTAQSFHPYCKECYFM